MTKDRLHYRLSKKHAHGAEEVERSIGITGLRHATGISSEEPPRPAGLMKWAFDDYVVEEELTEEAFLPPSRDHGGPSTTLRGQETPVKQEGTSGNSSSFVLRIISEGVPDPVIEQQLCQRLPRHLQFHFLTPVDFVSSTARYIWLRCSENQKHLLPQAFQGEQLWHTGFGEVYVYPIKAVRADPNVSTFPAHLLPSTRYTITLRNIEASLGDVLPQLRSVARCGFLNYSHVARHGVGLFRVYEDAKLLLRREYDAFLHHHLLRLTEGTTSVQREMSVLQEVLASPRSSRADWTSVARGMEAAVKHDAQFYARARQTGLYRPHHDLLLDFVQRATNVAPRYRDSALLLREAVKPLIVQETLHAITDVHFNALASLRWQRGRDTVMVGDLVRVQSTASPKTTRPASLDSFVGAADHINGAMLSSAHQIWSASREHEEAVQPGPHTGDYVRVRSTAEAALYRITDVVIPTLGKHAAGHTVTADAKDDHLAAALAEELRVEGFPEMQLAPYAASRPLIQTARQMAFYLVDEKRGWDWEEDAAASQLKASLYHDQEGILRYRSPLACRTGKKMVARLGIRQETARHFFLKPARKSGITCVLQFTLPHGCHATSVVREAFMVATLSPVAIFRLLSK